MLDLWGEPGSYRPIAGFEEGMPYFCLRVPTGGGKTRLGARSVPLVNRYLLQTEHSVILWLVPSNAIREQTIKAFRDREHPYHADLREAGPLTVLDLDEAKSLTRPTLDTSTVLIVATAQSFRHQDMDKLKVYESSGALQHHFDGLSPEQRSNLLPGPEGAMAYSLANVLRLRRPFVVVDEAHNARTELQFETLARFRPSGILELTATPDLKKTPSNVLHSVSATELKIESMIKLPILLETEANWQKVIAYAIDKRSQLQTLADREHLAGAAYLRPLVLIQSQPRSKDHDTLHAEALKEELMRNHGIPEDEIAIATGETKDLAEVDLFAKSCRIKFIITQQALAEGWDCSFAYVLASVAELRSETRVEQLLGRILRQPEATLRPSPELNRSYAYVASKDFGATAAALRDRLVEGAGFDQADAWQLVAAAKEGQSRLDLTPAHRAEIRPVVVKLAEKPNLSKLSGGLRKKVEWDAKAHTLTIISPITPAEDVAIMESVSEETSRKTLEEAAEKSRTEAITIFKTPSEMGREFFVPQLAVWVHGELQLFDDPEVLDYPWELPSYSAAPSGDEMNQLHSTDLTIANRQKFLLRSLLERKIVELRKEAVRKAYQEFLFAADSSERVRVGGDFHFEFHPDAYAPHRDCPRATEFAKHYYPRVGDFDSEEEMECAYWLDRAAQKGLIDFWVRNLVRKAASSFFLPTAKDRFHPDFICRLPGGRTLIVEYKGADRWKEAEDDRKVGELWAELSNGKCLFVMVKDKNWHWIEEKLTPS